MKDTTLPLKVPVEKRGMSSFEVEEALSREIRRTLNRISGSGRDGFVVEVNSKQQARTIKSMKTLCEKEGQVVANQFFDGSKGLVFLNNSNREAYGNDAGQLTARAWCDKDRGRKVEYSEK